jgi:LPXTG-motif cell wall-anchored protein
LPNHAGLSGTLANTGLPAWALIWLGIGILVAGVALLVFIGRRRPVRGAVR